MSGHIGQERTGTHLHIENLGLQRQGRWLFRHVTLTVVPGEFLAVVGVSGVGKSSFLACLAGLVLPSEGTVRYVLSTGAALSPEAFRPQLGTIFQNFGLVAGSTLIQNVLCGRLSRYPAWRTVLPFPRADREEAWHLLVDLGLAKHVHHWVAEVSGGEQQRTAIARSLFQEPELFLADEPVSNLDRYYSGRVLGILSQQTIVKNKSVLCVLHNPDFVERFANRVLSFDPENPCNWRVREVSP